MQHEEIVNALEGLLPDIKESGDPESAILKYASSHNLAPSQVERMGQVFNIAKTINYMDKSAGDRGGSFAVLDTVSLMSKYMEDKEEDVKEASNEIDAWIDTPSTSTTSKGVPDFFGAIEGRESAEWKVDEVSELPKIASHIYEEAKAETISKWEAENVDDIISETNDKIAAAFDKLAQDLELFAYPDKFKELSADVTDLVPGGKEACTLMQNYFHSKGLTLPDATEEKRAFAYDRTGFVEPFHSIVDSVEFLKEAQSFKKKILTKEAAQEARSNIRIPRPPPGIGRGTQAWDDWYRGSIDIELNRLDRQEQREYQEGLHQRRREESRQDREDEREQNIQDRETQETEREEREEQRQRKNEEAQLPGVGEVLKDTSLVKNLEGLGDSDVRNYLYNKALYHLNKIDDFSDVAGKLKTLDQAEDDVLESTTLQSLLLTDPIISEADPQQVTEIFNTLKSALPEIAKDKNLATFAIREAIEYGGIPMHTYKDITTVRKERSQALENESNRKKERYADRGTPQYKKNAPISPK